MDFRKLGAAIRFRAPASAGHSVLRRPVSIPRPQPSRPTVTRQPVEPDEFIPTPQTSPTQAPRGWRNQMLRSERAPSLLNVLRSLATGGPNVRDPRVDELFPALNAQQFANLTGQPLRRAQTAMRAGIYNPTFTPAQELARRLGNVRRHVGSDLKYGLRDLIQDTPGRAVGYGAGLAAAPVIGELLGHS